MGGDGRLKRLALATSSIFLLIVGVLLNIPQMYLMAVIISLLPVVFWFVGRYLQLGLTCQRLMPETCGTGERVAVQLTVRNNNLLPKFYLRLSDQMPRWVRFDGNALDESGVILRLPGNEKITVTYYIKPLFRGYHVIGPTKVVTSDLIGLSTYSHVLGTPDRILVYPEVLPVNSRLLSEGVSIGWQDQENAAARGSGSDFQGVREYRLGDDLRRLNWKTTARTGQLAVTEYAVGFAKDISVVLDIDGDIYDATHEGKAIAFEAAVQICVSVAAANLKAGSSARIVTANAQSDTVTVYEGQEDLPKLLRALALIEPVTASPVTKAIDTVVEDHGRSETVLVITGIDRSNRAVQDRLSRLANRHGTSGRPFVFWIDVAQFGLSNKRRQPTISSQSTSPYNTVSDEKSKGVIIGPQTSVRDVLRQLSL